MKAKPAITRARVLQIVRTVEAEAKTWRSKDGETLAQWQERRIRKAAARIFELLTGKAKP